MEIIGKDYEKMDFEQRKAVAICRILKIASNEQLWRYLESLIAYNLPGEKSPHNLILSHFNNTSKLEWMNYKKG